MTPLTPTPDAPDEIEEHSSSPFEAALRAQTEAPQPAGQGRRWVKPLLIVLGLAVVAGGIGGGLWYKQEMERRWKWERIPMAEKMARVPEVWPVARLAGRMQSSKKIRDAATFEEAAAQVGLTKILPGGYDLPPTAGPLDLARIFKDGPDYVKVTFPEGFTANQVSARLARHGFTGGAQLQKLAYPLTGFSSLEGRLFPDTYLMPLKGNGKNLAGRMQDRFLQVTNTLPRPFPQVNGKALTLSQVVVLASLVEREAASAQEMPQVAGVLVNRLRKPMRLQVDASVQYARVLAAMQGAKNEGHKERLLYSDLEIQSPFNTYQHDGLPPAPICNPGAAALKAAARPASSDYLFYVMSPKFKRHRFAKTFSEHQHNIALARQERAALEAAAKSQ